jgi:HPt (histidine-containing phosphotransfer) domain-containing protein
MKNLEKDIDRDFLNNYYKEMVDEIGDIFQLFIEEIPADLIKVKETFVNGNYTEASEILHKIAPSFYNIGLPSLTARIQPIETYISEKKYQEALNEIILFEADLNSYMPALKFECNRLKNLHPNT